MAKPNGRSRVAQSPGPAGKVRRHQPQRAPPRVRRRHPLGWRHLRHGKKHRSRLQAEFGEAIADKPIHVLDIPDEYQYMDPELVDLLKASVGSILGLP